MAYPIRLFFLTLTLGLTSCPAQQKQPLPSVSIDINSLGFKRISQGDWKRLNKEFLRHPDMMRVESEDLSTKIVFISNDTLAIYWTRGPNGEVRAEEPLVLQARFVNTNNGALKSEQSWAMRKRRFKSTWLDCEGRIFPVSGDRFIVCANNQLGLYSADFRRIATLDLETADDDMWTLQVIPGGRSIFLKDESRKGITYAWMDTDNLMVIRTDRGPARTVQPSAVAAFSDGYFVQTGETVRAIPSTKGPTFVCKSDECDWKTMFGLWPLYNGKVVVTGKLNFMVFDGAGSALWSRRASQEPASTAITTSLDGSHFAYLLYGSHIRFEGEKLRDEANYFVYDAAQARKVMFLRAPTDWDADFALSPDGSKFAQFYGTRVDIYYVSPSKGKISICENPSNSMRPWLICPC